MAIVHVQLPTYHTLFRNGTSGAREDSVFSCRGGGLKNFLCCSRREGEYCKIALKIKIGPFPESLGCFLFAFLRHFFIFTCTVGKKLLGQKGGNYLDSWGVNKVSCRRGDSDFALHEGGNDTLPPMLTYGNSATPFTCTHTHYSCTIISGWRGTPSESYFNSNSNSNNNSSSSSSNNNNNNVDHSLNWRPLATDNTSAHSVCAWKRVSAFSLPVSTAQVSSFSPQDRHLWRRRMALTPLLLNQVQGPPRRILRLWGSEDRVLKKTLLELCFVTCGGALKWGVATIKIWVWTYYGLSCVPIDQPNFLRGGFSSSWN